MHSKEEREPSFRENPLQSNEENSSLTKNIGSRGFCVVRKTRVP